MTLREFIKQNKEELDNAIRRVNIGGEPLNNEERELWVLNDEGLYNWARSESVKI